MWFPLTIAAAVLWGISYTLSEELYRHISVFTLLSIEFCASAIVFVFLSWYTGTFKTDLQTLSNSGRIATFLLICVVTLIVAELCINFSISDKNATIASLIEISYPFFVALFSWLFFRENNLTVGTTVGGLLIFLGATTIYFFNR